MYAKMGIFAIISLLLLVPGQAFAGVTSMKLGEESYDDDESLTFTGTQKGMQSVFVVIRDAAGNFKGMLSDPTPSKGEFSVTPKKISSLFSSEGIYNATAFTDDQKESEGVTIKLSYDDDKVTVYRDFVLELERISDKTVKARDTVSFTAKVTDSKIKQEEFSLSKEAPAGAKIDSDSGKFVWKSDGNIKEYTFDVIVTKGDKKDKEKVTITVQKPDVKPMIEPKAEEPRIKELGIAPFVDRSKDPQSYVDRYNNESGYKKWFDRAYPEYDSIYQAVGLEEPQVEEPRMLAPFVDRSKDPQSYVDRYNNESGYKKWFDRAYPEYDSIYQAVGLEEPQVEEPRMLAPFVDRSKDPQSYVDRYNNESIYKKWFDKTYPQYNSIYEAVGMEEPKAEELESGICGQGTRLVDGQCTVFKKIESGICGVGTELVDKTCEIVGKAKVVEKPWWQFW